MYSLSNGFLPMPYLIIRFVSAAVVFVAIAAPIVKGSFTLDRAEDLPDVMFVRAAALYPERAGAALVCSERSAGGGQSAGEGNGGASAS